MATLKSITYEFAGDWYVFFTKKAEGWKIVVQHGSRDHWTWEACKLNGRASHSKASTFLRTAKVLGNRGNKT